jgi:hypothetical protein
MQAMALASASRFGVAGGWCACGAASTGLASSPKTDPESGLVGKDD